MAGRMLVLERYRFPRDKPCGGGLTGHMEEALRELDLALEVPHVSAPEARVRFGGFERVVRMGRAVNVIRRQEFDHNLVMQIRRKGVEVIEGEGAVEVHAERDMVEVVTSRGRRLRARVVVGADGAASIVRRRVLPQTYRRQRGIWRGRQRMPHRLFQGELAVAAAHEQMTGASGAAGASAHNAWLDESAMLYDFTPLLRGLRGYLWVFPVPGQRLNVGLMHYPAYRLGGPRLVEILSDGLADVGISLPDKSTRGWPVWGYRPWQKISQPRMLLVGDAAGIDSLTGEGISVAMEQGMIAGDAIRDAFISGDVSFARYTAAVRRAVVGRELALDGRLAQLLYSKGERWRHWLSLLLYDPDVLDMYAARVSGSQVLADQQLRLYRALFRHLWRMRSRRHLLSGAVRGLLPAPP